MPDLLPDFGPQHHLSRHHLSSYHPRILSINMASAASLMGLPVELRLEIIEWSFPGARRNTALDELRPDAGSDMQITTEDCHEILALLRVNRQLHAEALPILYKSVRFWFQSDVEWFHGHDPLPAAITGFGYRNFPPYKDQYSKTLKYKDWTKNITKAGVALELPRSDDNDRVRELGGSIEYYRSKLLLRDLVQAFNRAIHLRTIEIECFVPEEHAESGNVSLMWYLQAFEGVRDDIELGVWAISVHKDYSFEPRESLCETKLLHSERAYIAKLTSESRSLKFLTVAGPSLRERFERLCHWLRATFSYMKASEEWIMATGRELEYVQWVSDSGVKAQALLEQAWEASERSDEVAFMTAVKGMRPLVSSYYETHMHEFEKSLEGPLPKRRPVGLGAVRR